ncbi:MAG TPA: response regulator [Baekduia sp.]|uniref:response regulator n=1 Tax=Baekduia sp. TaxID=2600305 RepID=UPI002D779442|nr:response regulator [Baekduia sp.]HET6508847.1 response regulator [Baekduia sp.]
MPSPDPAAERQSITILMADDDEDDRVLTADALRRSRLVNDMRFVVDGDDLMQYLRGEGVYAPGGVEAPRPGLILLDLNMPKKDGREALAEIKGDPDLRRIPVVVLTTSKAEEDIFRTYDLGVNSFVSKPVTFEELAKVMTTLARYWFELVELPEDGDDAE